MFKYSLIIGLILSLFSINSNAETSLVLKSVETVSNDVTESIIFNESNESILEKMEQYTLEEQIIFYKIYTEVFGELPKIKEVIIEKVLISANQDLTGDLIDQLISANLLSIDLSKKILINFDPTAWGYYGREIKVIRRLLPFIISFGIDKTNDFIEYAAINIGENRALREFNSVTIKIISNSEEILPEDAIKLISSITSNCENSNGSLCLSSFCDGYKTLASLFDNHKFRGDELLKLFKYLISSNNQDFSRLYVFENVMESKVFNFQDISNEIDQYILYTKSVDGYILTEFISFLLTEVKERKVLIEYLNIIGYDQLYREHPTTLIKHIGDSVLTRKQQKKIIREVLTYWNSQDFNGRAYWFTGSRMASALFDLNEKSGIDIAIYLLEIIYKYRKKVFESSDKNYFFSPEDDVNVLASKILYSIPDDNEKKGELIKIMLEDYSLFGSTSNKKDKLRELLQYLSNSRIVIPDLAETYENVVVALTEKISVSEDENASEFIPRMKNIVMAQNALIYGMTIGNQHLPKDGYGIIKKIIDNNMDHSIEDFWACDTSNFFNLTEIAYYLAHSNAYIENMEALLSDIVDHAESSNTISEENLRFIYGQAYTAIERFGRQMKFEIKNRLNHKLENIMPMKLRTIKFALSNDDRAKGYYIKLKMGDNTALFNFVPSEYTDDNRTIMKIDGLDPTLNYEISTFSYGKLDDYSGESESMEIPAIE